MTAITTTEAGATGRYIDIAVASALNNIANQANGMTIVAYVKPAAQSVLGYIVSKCDSGGNGMRFGINTGGQVFFAPYGCSGSGLAPSVLSAPVTNGSWVHIEATAVGNGSLVSNTPDLQIAFDGTAQSITAQTNGTGTVSSDTANHLFLLNRTGLGREFVGDLGFVAIWNRVLTSTELTTVRTTGPLDVTSGLVFCFANGQDYSPTAASVNGRSTQVAGSTPPNTALGGSSGGASATTESFTSTSSLTDAIASGGAGGSGTGTTETFTSTGSVADATATASSTATTESFTSTGSVADASAGTVTIISPADRGTLDLPNCSVTPNGLTPQINLKNKRYVADDNTTGARFTFFKVTGVNGMTPVFSVARTGMDLSSDNKWLWSYTGNLDDWHEFDNISNGTTTTFWVSSNNSAFAQDTVYVSQNFPWPAGYTLPWLNSLATAHPTRIGYAPSGAGSFQFNTRSATTDGVNAIAAQPMYSAKISSGSGNAPDGLPKRKMVLISGVHSSEDVGNYALRGAVEYLLSGAAQAETVLSWFDVTLYPVVAAAGRPGAAGRGDYESAHMTYDVNRHWRDTSMESIVKHKAAIATDTGSNVTVFMDFHGQHYGYDAHIDNVQLTTGNATIWQNAIRTYWPTMPINNSVVDPGISTNYATLDLGCQWAINPEHQYWTTETNTPLIGQYHMQAVADMAVAGVFSAGAASATPESFTSTSSVADASASGNGGATATPENFTSTGSTTNATATGNANATPENLTSTGSVADATASGTAGGNDGTGTTDNLAGGGIVTDANATGGASATPGSHVSTGSLTDAAATGTDAGGGAALPESFTSSGALIDTTANGSGILVLSAPRRRLANANTQRRRNVQ